MTKFRKRFIGLAALVAVFFLSAVAGWAAIDPSTVQKLVAGDGAAGDSFGASVSVSGDTAIIGTLGDDDNGDNSGSAYVFLRNGNGEWAQQAKLLPDDGGDYDTFGHSVSVSGDVVVVGAIFDGEKETNSGSAYVFVRNGDGSWSQESKLLPDDEETDVLFGCAVSVFGDTIVIGSKQDNGNGNGIYSGSSYVFVRNKSGSWVKQAKLLPGDGAAYSYFGNSVSISGNIVIIGDSLDTTIDNGNCSGSAYVFIRDELGNWSQEAKLLPTDGDADDRFGNSVAIDGSTAIIGPYNDDDNGSNTGSAYIFVRDGTGIWSQQKKLLPPEDFVFVNTFGTSVSLSGGTAVVGAGYDSNNLFGAANIFTRDETGNWTYRGKLVANDSTDYNAFGHSVSISGNHLVVGSYNHPSGGAGAAYVYSSTPTTSNVAVTVTAPASGTTYNHGNQVTINWETENADPADTMVLSMKRDAASGMAAPDNRSWYRFTENTPNDGTETVTIPDSALTASDWRFYVRHASSGEYAASGTVEVANAANVAELYIEKSGDGLGTVAGAPQKGIIQYLTLCDVSCTSYLHRLSAGEAFVLIAEADTNSVFSGWKGCDLVSDNACLITVNDYEEVSAQFNAAEDATVELSVSFFEQPYEQGSVVSDPPGISCSDSRGNCRAKFVPGQTVTLTPTAAHGAIFEEWQNTWDSTPCNSQSGNACIITIPTSGRLNVRPNFAPDIQQNLNLVIEGNGSGSVTSTSGGINCNSDGTKTACNEIFEEGTGVTLEAVADPDSVFLRWDGWYVNPCFESDDPECTFTMWWPHTVKAIFSAENLAVEIHSDVDVIDDGYTSYYIDVQNNGIADSGEAVVEIAASSVGNGEELTWRCVDEYNAGKGTCEKNGNTFTVTVNQNEHIKIIVARRYGSDVNTATLGAIVSYSKDADPSDNEKSVKLHRDPAALLGLRTEVLLQYLDGKPTYPSERNTLIFTHGWQDTDPDDCEGLQEDAMLKCFSKHLWTGMNKDKGQVGGIADKNLAITAPNALAGQVNILQYIWAGAFTETGMKPKGYIKARRHVFDAGTRLGKQLIKDLGGDYSGKIHFVGHSLGTAVNAYAVRHFLDNNTAATVQMTILDHPNRISRIGLLDDMSDEEEKQWGFDHDFFASVLPEINKPEFSNRLYVDNYFAEGTFDEIKLETAGVGTSISGKNVYNHLSPIHQKPGMVGTGLNAPKGVGELLFWKEGVFIFKPVYSPVPPNVTWESDRFFNDHSGVHQWYRWTMWPDRTEYLRENQFVCSNGVWDDKVDGTPHHSSLNPCNTGFAHSILREGWQPEDFPLRNGYATDSSPAAQYDMVGGGTNQRCSMTESPLQITCSNLPAPMQPELALAADQSESAPVPIETASDYLHTKINLSKEIGSLSFDYRLTNTDSEEPVHLLIDGVVVWSMSAQSDTPEEWTASGKIPFALTKGEHTLMLAFNRTSEDAEYAMRELQFFEASNKNGFLPAMLFLLLNK
ncbi:hypothetical protein GMJAKD_01850 [Candidatus Electrothrix aarhusensis]